MSRVVQRYNLQSSGITHLSLPVGARPVFARERHNGSGLSLYVLEDERPAAVVLCSFTVVPTGVAVPSGEFVQSVALADSEFPMVVHVFDTTKSDPRTSTIGGVANRS